MEFLTGPVPNIELVSVPAGEFVMGQGDGDPPDARMFAELVGVRHMPAHSVTLQEYEIGKRLVSFREYRMFCEDTGYTPPGFSATKDKKTGPAGYLRWNDAYLFCQWLSLRTGDPYHLPTEAEWEKAALWDPTANAQTPVVRIREYNRSRGVSEDAPIEDQQVFQKFYENIPSAYGCERMGSELVEWCNSLLAPYPYKSDDRESPDGPGRRAQRSGGLYGHPASPIVRGRPSDRDFHSFGFRVVRGAALREDQAAFNRAASEYLQQLQTDLAEQIQADPDDPDPYMSVLNYLIELRDRFDREAPLRLAISLATPCLAAIERKLTRASDEERKKLERWRAFCRYNRALAYVTLEDYQSALTDIEWCLQTEFADHSDHYLHGRILRGLGQLDLAEGKLMRDSRRPSPNLLFEWALLESARGDYAESNEHLLRAQELEVVNLAMPEIYPLRARNCAALGDERGAQSARLCHYLATASELSMDAARRAMAG